jgi:hypothetical protein
MSSADSAIGRNGASVPARFPADSSPGMTRVAVLATLVFLSLLLKLALLYDVYYNGFLVVNYDVVNLDEMGYLDIGRELHVADKPFDLGGNWLYGYVNYFALMLTSDIGTAYLLLCFMNMTLSFLSPLLLLPVVRDCFKDRELQEKAALIFLVFVLLWPEGAYLAVRNLKDTLLQFLVCAFVLVFHSFMKHIDGGGLSKGRMGGYFLAAAALMVMIFSLRMYLAAMLFAIAFFPLLTRKPLIAALAIAAVAAVIIAFPDTFIEYLEKNWLFSADAAKDVAEEIYNQGGQARINHDLIGISTAFLRFFLMPVPTTPVTVYQAMEIFQSGIVYLLAYFWFKGIREVPSSFRGFTLWLFLLIGVFYGIAELFSGPRQRFSSFDHLYLVAASVGLARAEVKDITMAIGVAYLIYLIGKHIALYNY